MEEIKRRYEDKIKRVKNKYKKEYNDNKYKKMNDKECIKNEYKISKLIEENNNKIKNLIQEKQLENLYNIKKLNEIIYNTYNKCNNNYYYIFNLKKILPNNNFENINIINNILDDKLKENNEYNNNIKENNINEINLDIGINYSQQNENKIKQLKNEIIKLKDVVDNKTKIIEEQRLMLELKDKEVNNYKNEKDKIIEKYKEELKNSKKNLLDINKDEE